MSYHYHENITNRIWFLQLKSIYSTSQDVIRCTGNLTEQKSTQYLNARIFIQIDHGSYLPHHFQLIITLMTPTLVVTLCSLGY
jgi:hypothetical protein